MKIKRLVIVYFICILTSHLNGQGIVTNYYCILKGQYYVLPINATNDSAVARIMFENFTNAAGIRFDPQSLICNNTYIPVPFNIIKYPNVLSSNLLSKSEIKIFSEKNYKGDMATIPVGVSLSCMDPNNPSFDENSEKIIRKVGNDKISSILIPKGLKLTAWEHCPFEGRSRIITSNIADLEDWDDVISSLKVALIDSLFFEDATYIEVTKENYSSNFPLAQSMANFPLETKNVSYAMSSINNLQNSNSNPNSWVLQSMYGTNTYCIINQKTGDYLHTFKTNSFSIGVRSENTKSGSSYLDKSFLWFLQYDPLTKTHQITNMLTGVMSNLSFDAVKNIFYLGQNPLDIKNARWILTPNLH
ncbi:MAG: hypothetical protein CFE25_16290 [Chitinophagaceae bacterium BSSC1]|nr:MAG: hypothetical protein CFE25_16290 [Chitinophagaceae bacterium BSSC1]